MHHLFCSSTGIPFCPTLSLPAADRLSSPAAVNTTGQRGWQGWSRVWFTLYYLMNHLLQLPSLRPRTHADLAAYRRHKQHAAAIVHHTNTTTKTTTHIIIRTTLGSVGKGVIGGGALGRSMPGVGANVLFVPAFTLVLARAAVARIAIVFIIFEY